LVLARGALDLVAGIRVAGLPDLARLGPVILAPNHTSFLDPPLLQVVCRRHLSFLITEEIYQLPLARAFFRLWETIPVPEQGSPARAVKAALRAIARGRSVCIFPEGGISRDGYLQPGRDGVVTLMLRARVPVIPVAILGSYRILPYEARIPRPGQVLIRFGEPIQPPARMTRQEVPGFQTRIMDAIHALGAPRQGEPLELWRYRR